MAQIQRKQRLEDTLDLLDESGKICYTLPVSIDLEQSFARVNMARKNAAAAETALQKNGTAEAIENYGKAICELFASVFGDDSAEKICCHYSNRYTEMLLDILPYLIKEVFPKFDALSSERLKQAVELRKTVDSIRGNRAQRRHSKYHR